MPGGALLNESRTISSLIAQTHDETNYWIVGEHGCKSIAVEAVNGPHSPLAWFAIQTEKGFIRVNGAFVYSVEYANAT